MKDEGFKMKDAVKSKLTRSQMAARVAAEFADGWIVNLGVGMPTLCSDHVPAGRRVTFHAENGVIGYGHNASEDELDPHVVNASVQPVVLLPFAAIIHHADSFAIIRSGRLDLGVLGAYEVAANGDFANWKTAGRVGGGIGGAMDIAANARRIFIMMEHTTRDGAPRLRRRCTLPVTAPGVVKLIVTDLGVFEPLGEAYRLKEIAPGYNSDEVQAVTEAPLVVDPELAEVRV
jgi:3-oxoacid CoA-transferase B subunit